MQKTARAHVNGEWITTKKQLRAAIASQYAGGPSIGLVSLNMSDYGQSFDITANVSAIICRETYESPIATVYATPEGWKIA